jgi:hypothetical protein
MLKGREAGVGDWEKRMEFAMEFWKMTNSSPTIVREQVERDGWSFGRFPQKACGHDEGYLNFL